MSKEESGELYVKSVGYRIVSVIALRWSRQRRSEIVAEESAVSVAWFNESIGTKIDNINALQMTSDVVGGSSTIILYHSKLGRGGIQFKE